MQAATGTKGASQAVFRHGPVAQAVCLGRRWRRLAGEGCVQARRGGAGYVQAGSPLIGGLTLAPVFAMELELLVLHTGERSLPEAFARAAARRKGASDPK